MDCFYLSVLYTFFLGMLEDINDPDTAAWHVRPDVWHSFRAGYMCYEEQLLRLLEAHSARTTRAGASARDEAAFDAAAHYRYTWSEGWLPVARAP